MSSSADAQLCKVKERKQCNLATLQPRSRSVAPEAAAKVLKNGIFTATRVKPRDGDSERASARESTSARAGERERANKRVRARERANERDSARDGNVCNVEGRREEDGVCRETVGQLESQI